MLPLPKGEGWGEGEVSARTSLGFDCGLDTRPLAKGSHSFNTFIISNRLLYLSRLPDK